MPNINSANNLFLNQPVTKISASYTASQLNDFIIEVTSTSSVVTVTLPAPSSTGNIGKAYIIKDSSGSAAINNISIIAVSGKIDGLASTQITSNYGAVQLFCDGSNYYSFGSNNSGFFILNERVFTSSGTYIPTNGTLYCEIEMVGGGGGGGGAGSPGSGLYTGGSGGGGGEYAYGIFAAAQIGTSQSITIGAAGSATSGGAGGNGGNTSLGSLISANGGQGGTTAAAAVAFNIAGSLGGTGGTGGNYRFPGDVGGNSSGAVTASILFGGIGGSSAKGAGGNEGTQASGFAGLGYGAGGGGGSQSPLGGAVSGGAGSAGAVFITEYIATSAASLTAVTVAQASWSRQSSTAFTPGSTVVAINFTSDPGTTPSNAASRLDFSSLTGNIGSGMTISQFQVTITQAGIYQVLADSALVWLGVANCIMQLVKNTSTVLAMGSAQIQTGAALESLGLNYIGSFNVGDTLDLRYNTAQAIGFLFWDISVSITQLCTSVIVPIATGWIPVAGTSQFMAANSNYYTQNSSLTTLTLPIAASAGTTMQIAGSGSGGWILAQNAAQSINFGNQVTTTGSGGSIASSNQYDGITLLCVVANTQWMVLGSTGNLVVI